MTHNFEAQDKKSYISEPLVTRLWLNVDSTTVSETLCKLGDCMQNLNIRSPGMLQLQVNVSLSHIGPGNLDCLTRLISRIQNAAVGIEQTRPKMSIYIPHHLVSASFVERVNQLDIYYPRIELYILVPSSDVSSLPQSDEAYRLANLLHEQYMSFRLLLLLDLSAKSLELLQDGEAESLLHWLKERCLFPYPPVFEVSFFRRGQKTSAFVEPLLVLVEKHPELLKSATSGYCGLVALLSRAVELYRLERKEGAFSVLPLLCCGAGVSFFPSCSSTLAHLQGCPYRIPDSINCLTMIQDYCLSCPYVKYCSGCLVAFSRAGRCHLRPYYTKLMSAFHKSPSLVGDLILKEPEIPILYHDWDYIYDPFREG